MARQLTRCPAALISFHKYACYSCRYQIIKIDDGKEKVADLPLSLCKTKCRDTVRAKQKFSKAGWLCSVCTLGIRAGSSTQTEVGSIGLVVDSAAHQILTMALWERVLSLMQQLQERNASAPVVGGWPMVLICNASSRIAP